MKKRLAFIALLLVVSVLTMSSCDVLSMIPGFGENNQTGDGPSDGSSDEKPDEIRVTHLRTKNPKTNPKTNPRYQKCLIQLKFIL